MRHNALKLKKLEIRNEFVYNNCEKNKILHFQI